MVSHTGKDSLPKYKMFEKLVAPQADKREYKILYFNILTFLYWHIAGLYGLYLCFASAKWVSILNCFIFYLFGQLGIIAGAHRLWCHRSYKTKLPLEIILIFFNSIGFQNTAIDWVRNHRLHHKYSDTDADPHNATRGFFFSHLGWLITKKHPAVKKFGKTIDLSDIYNNPVLTFQKKYAIPVIGICCFVLPTVIPMYFWGETFNNAWHINILRYMLNLNATFLVNSAAHKWGYKPYDKNILPTECPSVSLVSLGEGFHNYHHVFPWDYKSEELGNNILNFTTKFIDFFAFIGWAYDLKSVPDDILKIRALRTGDGTAIWRKSLSNGD
ncbi:acyl-CoA Delta(11) desaturase-like [Hyposmocoma kahamanoa]|uniref:acyl-CoA Delta(11) desaturase-like n=1 Tax=Hyposmocoma kahamanoa TaxID=1477025 RepID=UPI000E6D60B2|nr:acyl-CoA Delta(11) desaturase-like [Hyposmocoma kahamanoa]